MITKLAINILFILLISISLWALYRTLDRVLEKRIKNLLEENDALLDANYKLARKIDRQNKLIGSQEKIISDLSEEVKQYRNTFNHD